MNLDERLGEILRDGALGNYTKNPDGDFVPLDWSGTPNDYFTGSIAQIKQALVDYGWRDVIKDKKGVHQAIEQAKVLTGQEWYDRFEKNFHAEFEYPADHPQLASLEIKRAVLEAAKKAAGLK